jgi:hypothetical protein
MPPFFSLLCVVKSFPKTPLEMPNSFDTDQIEQVLSQLAQSLDEIQLVDVEKFQNTAITEPLQSLKSQILDIHREIDTASSITAISYMQEIIRLIRGITRENLKRKAALIVRKCKKTETACNLAARSLLIATRKMTDLLATAKAQSSDWTSLAAELEDHATDLHMHSENCHTAAIILTPFVIGLFLFIPAKVCHDQANAKDEQSRNCSLANQNLNTVLIPVMERSASAYSCIAQRLKTLGDLISQCALQAEEAEEARLETEKHLNALRTQDLTIHHFDDANETSAHDQCIEAEYAFEDAWDSILKIACELDGQLARLCKDLRNISLQI